MILETKLSNLDNKPIKVNKKSPPRSINPDLTPFYFTAMFILLLGLKILEKVMDW
jgi:hypothetical protein